MKNSDRKKKLDREWRKANPEKCKKFIKKAYIKTMSTPKGRLDHSMATAINTALSGNKDGRHWETLIDYTLTDLMQHLEKQFQSGMSWDNYGKWHVDHKTPISAFNYSNSKDIDFKRCWALENLQPLWARDNIRKSNKLEKAFQPYLPFSSDRRENCVQS